MRDAGTLPAELAGFLTKTDIAPLVYKGIKRARQAIEAADSGRSASQRPSRTSAKSHLCPVAPLLIGRRSGRLRPGLSIHLGVSMGHWPLRCRFRHQG